MTTERPSLADPDLALVWAKVRERLERQGLDNRGRLRLPSIGAAARLTLQALTGRRPGATVDLAALEQGLRGLGLGDDLPAALATLGHPVSGEPARRRAERAVARAARDAARSAAATWPEPWATAWIDEVVRTGGLRGCDPEQAVGLVRSVRAIIDHLDGAGAEGDAAPLGRVDLAARLFGSAHALDSGTRLEAAATRALAHRLGAGRARDLWERAGAHLDLTSAPVLTWRLPVAASCGLATLVAGATALAAPLHLSQLALRSHPVVPEPGADVLVVENPRVVEAAAQLGVPAAVVAANGNPSGAVQLLVRQLAAGGARLRYHGDFDPAGLAICARMQAMGCTPWRMGSADYLAALAAADAEGVDLPAGTDAAPPTPWDPVLQQTFDRHRRIVHEERLLPALLAT